jgi:hypothetical protein
MVIRRGPAEKYRCSAKLLNMAQASQYLHSYGLMRGAGNPPGACRMPPDASQHLKDSPNR